MHRFIFRNTTADNPEVLGVQNVEEQQRDEISVEKIVVIEDSANLGTHENVSNAENPKVLGVEVFFFYYGAWAIMQFAQGPRSGPIMNLIRIVENEFEMW